MSSSPSTRPQVDASMHTGRRGLLFIVSAPSGAGSSGESAGAAATADPTAATGPLPLPLPVCGASGELAGTDWLPFRTLMRRNDVIVMLGHARLIALDRTRPVSFSRSVVRGLLRSDWGYDGLLMTDDFSMGAVTHSPEGIGGVCQ